MDVGGSHQCCALFFFLSHDALERVFLPFALLMVVHQMHYFVAMGPEEFTLHGKEAGRIVVVDAMACRALQAMCISPHLPPLPASFMKYRATLRANRWLQRFVLGFVGIVHAFLEKTIVPGNLAEIGGDALSSHGEQYPLVTVNRIVGAVVFRYISIPPISPSNHISRDFLCRHENLQLGCSLG
jgi:hypothetical protein